MPTYQAEICICLGSWRTAFMPEKNSMQQFHVDEDTTETVPMMTRTGQYHYFNDKVKTYIGLLLLYDIKLGCRWVFQTDSLLCCNYTVAALQSCEAATEQTVLHDASAASRRGQSHRHRVHAAHWCHHVWLVHKYPGRVSTCALLLLFCQIPGFICRPLGSSTNHL